MNSKEATAGWSEGPNLYLVGFMGTGKSAIGRRLAESMRMSFIDSDHAIEEREKRTIPEIFEQEGEAFFRRLEEEFIQGGHPGKGCVVSCGGGLVIQPGMLERLKQKGIVICLYASAETVIDRTRSNTNRPLLRGPDPEKRVRELLAEREPLYRQAGTLVTTDNRPLAEVVRHISRIYCEQAAEWVLTRKTDEPHG